MITPAVRPLGLTGAITDLLKTTAHLPRLSDTAPFGVLLHDGAPPLHTEPYLGVEGKLKAAFVRPEMQMRIEIWERLEPPSGNTLGEKNIRVILDASGDTTYWDLGPSPRRSPGGALLSVGGFEESQPLDIGERRYIFRVLHKVVPHQIEANSKEDFTSSFEMVPLLKQRFSSWKVSEGDANDYFRCALEITGQSTAAQLAISKNGWHGAVPRQFENPGRLFRHVENSFRPHVSDAKKIFD